MKEIAIGCVSAILGLMLGAALGFGVSRLVPSASAPTIPAPIAAPGQADVSVVLSAAFLNAQMQQVAKPSGIKSLSITLAAPNVMQAVAVVETSVLGQKISVNVRARTRVTVQSGRIRLTVEQVETSGVSVPSSLVNSTVETLRVQAETQVNLLVQRALQGTSLRVTGVVITPNDVTFLLKGG